MSVSWEANGEAVSASKFAHSAVLTDATGRNKSVLKQMDFAKKSYCRCHGAHKSAAAVYRVRQKAHLAQCPLAGSANVICLQKMSRKKGNKACLLDIPSRNSSLQQVLLDLLSQRLSLNNYF